MGEEGGDQDQLVQWEAQGSNARQEKILVSVRLRPLNAKESQSNDFSDWECINSTTIIFKNCLNERSMYPNAYTFDRVFGFDSSTRQVYEEAAKEVALSVLNGINSSVFAYGQTSSGKTYTMGGITQYAVADMYDYIYQHAEREFMVKFGAMEIYNEHVRDLLSADPTPLRLLDDPERGTVVERLTEEIVRDKSHLLELIAVCEAQRQIGETSLNETSSRSHQILRLTIESSPRQLGRGTSSMLAASVNFVDLAGSERTSQTLASGTRLKEGSHINRSLLTLGKCIRSLSKGRNGHVPYRDSKLTRILQNSLGGNARTAIICTMSPAHSHLEQSRNTLLFASCAKQVSTNARVNVVMSEKALVKHLRKELARLEKELAKMSLVSSKGDVAAVLKEKELQIEKMDKEMRELSRQRDAAQSRLEELLSSGGRTSSSPSQDSGSRPQTSESRRSLSWLDDSSLTSDASDYQRLEVDLAPSESLKFLQENEGLDLISHHRELLENFDDNLLPDESASQVVSLISPECARPSDDQSPPWEDMTNLGKSNSEIEDNCKEVQCIEVQVPSADNITEIPDPVKISPREEEKEDKEGSFNEEQTGKEKESKEENEKGSFDMAENDTIVSSEKKEEVKSHDNEAEYDALVKRIKELQTTINHLVSRNLTEEQAPSGSTETDGLSPRRLNFNRSRSCKAIITSTIPSSPIFEKVVLHHRDQSFGGLDKVMTPERPKGLPRAMDISGDGNRKLSRLAYSISMKNPIISEKKEDAKFSEVNETSEVSSSDSGRDGDAKLEADKTVVHEMIGTIAEEEVKEVVEPEKSKSNSVGNDAVESGESVGDEAVKSGENVGFDTVKSGESTGDAVVKSRESVEDDALKSGESTGDAAVKSRESVEDDALKSGESTGDAAVKSRESVEDDAVKSGESTGDAAVKSRESVEDDAVKSRESVEDDAVKSGESTGDAAVKSRESVEDDAVKSGESVGDAAVDIPQERECMPDRASSTVQSPLSWEEEFESQQSKIIELWHACNVPLVHRTYFFLLFKGDPSDKVYMDVELRRLSFIKSRFSQGQKIVLDGQTFTQSQSMKALNQEREVLMKQMYKKIPPQEREPVFRNWGIDVNSKQRRLQLARRLWTEPKDMQHIKESAALVARLIDFTDESQVPKEMFVGPSITPRTLNRRSYSWKAGVSSFA